MCGDGLKDARADGELREKWLNEGFADPFEVRIGIKYRVL